MIRHSSGYPAWDVRSRNSPRRQVPLRELAQSLKSHTRNNNSSSNRGNNPVEYLKAS